MFIDDENGKVVFDKAGFVDYMVNGHMTGTGDSYETASDQQRRLIDAAYNTAEAPPGYCAMWVTNVFGNAGFSAPGGNANTMYYDWCNLDISEIQPGMIIAVPRTNWGAGWTYGHVGIYIGDGQVMDSTNYGKGITAIDVWVQQAAPGYTARCGWARGVDLSM
jgi:cell wall-associated NlpC family hydrolase